MVVTLWSLLLLLSAGIAAGTTGNEVEELAIPPHEDAARVARFVAHTCDWGALATISAQDPPMAGQPFANVFSMSDGPIAERGSGVPYMYLTELEVSVRDLKVRLAARLGLGALRPQWFMSLKWREMLEYPPPPSLRFPLQS